ncbi:MAG: N-acetylglucosamine-6-phosphate deacetylase [bacterium]|jgi:N-acetylglucosamine-6-phosphate deacetylase
MIEESGIDALTGGPVRVVFSDVIASAGPFTGAGFKRVFVAPAWIDLQVNGYAGVDFNDPAAPHDAIARAIGALHATGVARFFPTVITGSPERMCGALRNLADARERVPGGAAIEGFHIEGPYISAEDGPRGAHPRRWVRRPDIHEFHRMQEAARGLIRIVTLAPEWPDAPRFIERVTEEGVVAAIGHTAADAAQIAAAVSAGARISTHLGNAAHSTIERRSNYIWEQLAEDRLAASFIVDGFHLDAAFLKVALRAKRTGRAILVTDAAQPAGAAPGRYRLGEQDVEYTADGRIVLAGASRLAGSALSLDRAISNVMRIAGIPLSDAVAMATLNPARAARIEGRLNGLAPGERGDIAVFTLGEGAISIERTYSAGELVFSRS